MPEPIVDQIRRFVLDTFLPGENPDDLTTRTPLISGGILDSIATLKLVMFLEERFRIKLEAHEADREHLDTLESIVALVNAKQGQELR
jgi:acyl carrier protein